MVVLSSRQHMEELRKAPNDELSFIDEVNEVSPRAFALVLSDEHLFPLQTVQMQYTVGREVFHNPYHATVVRLQLTRNLGTLYSEMRDEIVTTFDEVLDVRGNGE